MHESSYRVQDRYPMFSRGYTNSFEAEGPGAWRKRTTGPS